MNNKGYRRILIIGAGIITVCSVLAFALFGWKACILFLMAGALLLTVFVVYTRQRFRQIEEVNDYLSKLLSGNYDLDICSNEEGELSILKNNIYKATILLGEKNELLEQEKQYLRDMLANISHQLKTPLTSVMMMNELLSGEKSEEKRKEFLKIENQQLEKMNWLITTLLKLSKLDAGTVRLKEEEVMEKELITESLEPFLIRMELAGIRLESKAGETCIKADRNWTVEALRNIIKNSIEHMDRGGVLRIECSENSLVHSIRILDTGCGIPEEELPYIFDRFYKSRTSSSEGVGIGLSLSKTIIEKQHGSISASSTPGKGSCFEIRLYKTII